MIKMKELQNKVLLRQLKKIDIKDFSSLDEKKFSELLKVIELTYEEMDNSVYRLENSLDVSFKELNHLTQNLEERIGQEVESNRKKDKQLLIQSKFASMGEMIANIAHQWRQPLSAISFISSSKIVQIDLNATTLDDDKKSFQKILELTNFLSQTIEAFRDYFKKENTPKTFDVIDCMNKTISIVELSYKNSGIKILNEQKDINYFTKGYQNELKQVFLNILNNAKDALLVKEIDEKMVKIDYKIVNKSIEISICDNAGGIAKDIIDKIFEPYFTTKHKSQGTGIGLYMCKQIIEKHARGEIFVENKNFTIENKEYEGACFFIVLKDD